jgi:hypothetical protein
MQRKLCFVTTIDPAVGLLAATVGAWAEDKYLHVEHYARMFARSMKAKWDCRAYLELFSGPGRALVKGTRRIIDTAPLRVLMLAPGFDLHVCSEIDRVALEALESRCRSLKPDAQWVFVLGDVNETWPTLLDHVRRSAGHGTSLTFSEALLWRLHRRPIRSEDEKAWIQV